MNAELLQNQVMRWSCYGNSELQTLNRYPDHDTRYIQTWAGVCVLGLPLVLHLCVLGWRPIALSGWKGPFAAAAHRGTFRDTWVLEENGKQLSQELGFRYQPASPSRLAKASVLYWLTVSARIPSLVYLPNVCKKTHTTSSNGVCTLYLPKRYEI